MSDANQVRINELARELEVKAKAIIHLLLGCGVSEKNTHSTYSRVHVEEKVGKTIQAQADADAAEVQAAKHRDAAAKAAARPRPIAPPAAPPAPAPPIAEIP